MQPVSLVDALRPRSIKILKYITQRMPGHHEWNGYHPDEGLEGYLDSDPGTGGVFIHYQRPGRPHAAFLIWNPKMTDVVTIERDEPTVIDSREPEIKVKEISIPPGTNIQTTLSHTFSKTTSLSESVKVGAEATAKASVGADVGVNVSAEVSLKIYAEYSRTWGESETESNTESQTLTFDGPKTIRYECTRSVNTERRIIRALTDFNFDIVLIDDLKGSPQQPNRIDIATPWVDFKQTVRGLSPADYGFYQAFINNPLTSEEYEDLIKPPSYYVEFPVTYNRVLHQSIKVIDET